MTFLKSPFYAGDATVPEHTQRSAHATQQAGQTERDDEKHAGYGENHAVMHIRHGPRPNHPVRPLRPGAAAGGRVRLSFLPAASLRLTYNVFLRHMSTILPAQTRTNNEHIGRFVAYRSEYCQRMTEEFADLIEDNEALIRRQRIGGNLDALTGIAIDQIAKELGERMPRASTGSLDIAQHRAGARPTPGPVNDCEAPQSDTTFAIASARSSQGAQEAAPGRARRAAAGGVVPSASLFIEQHNKHVFQFRQVTFDNPQAMVRFIAP